MHSVCDMIDMHVCVYVCVFSWSVLLYVWLDEDCSSEEDEWIQRFHKGEAT